MNFELTEEHLMIQKAARDFAQNELKPGVIERDEHQKFPAAQVKKMGELGFLGMMVKPKYGGGGLDTISYVLAMEEVSRGDAATSVREHLKLCDFCSAELPLLAFHEPTSDTFKAPEIPMNLRILAESILIRIKSV